MSETSAGSIVGFLRLDIASFEKGIAKAQALVDRLDGKNVDVTVKVDTAGAETKLAAVAASEDRVSKSSKGSSTGLDSVVASARKLSDASAQANVAQLRLGEMQGSGTAKASALASAQNTLARAQRDVSDAMKNASPEAQRLANSMGQADLSNVKVVESNKKVAKSSEDASLGMGSLIAAAVAVGPAIVPIALGATGLAVGFGAMGAAGIAALVGIKQEMALGSPLGLSYTNMLSTLGNNLQDIGHVAALGVLGPFQQEVAHLQTQMPSLIGIIGEFSVITGKTAGLLVNGLISAFIAFEPVARQAGVYVLDLSQRFASLMTGPGVASFGNYIQSVFPQVMRTVESVVTAVIRLVAAIAPMGMGSLGILKALADAINAIPVNVLSVLAAAGAAAYVAFKSYGLLSAGVSALGGALKVLGVSAETAAGGMVALNIAAGAVAVVIGIAMLAFDANANSTRAAQQAADDYTNALNQSNGAIDANVRSMTIKNLSDSGALDAAKTLGLSLSTVTSAALGNSTAMASVTAVAKPMIVAYNNAEMSTGKSTKAFAKNGQAATDLLTALGLNNTALKTGQQAYKDQAAAMATSSTVTDSVTASADRAANAQQAIAGQAAVAAQKMSDENDAAGILKQTLDLLNGKAISAAQAQNSFDTSLVNMGDHVSKTGKKITYTTTSIMDMSSASVALRTELLGQVTNMQNVVEGNAGLSKSTKDSARQYAELRQQIIDNAVAHGVNRDAVTAYVDKVLKSSKQLQNLPPTALDIKTTAADAKIAVFQKEITAIKQGKVPGVDVNTAEGKAGIAALQLQVYALHQGHVPTVTATVAAGTAEVASLQAQILAVKQGKVPGLTANSKAGQVVIAEYQARIDAIRQWMATRLAANSKPAEATVSALQTMYNRIHQMTPTVLNANSAPATQKVNQLQRVILGLTGKTVEILVSFNNSVTNGLIQTPATWGPIKKAGGGAIDGVGSGTSDSNLILASKGEHMLTADDVTAAGGHGAITAWRKSLHVRGYAGGGPIVIDMPSGGALTSAINSAYPPVPAGGFKINPAFGFGGGSGGGGVAQWAPLILQALAMLGQGPEWLPTVESRMMRESGGNPRAINLTDSNAMAGHPSMGLMQTIPGTFAAYAGSLAGRGIWDPLANIYAGLNYAIHTYGSLIALMKPGGYANGTNNASPGWHKIGENGPEWMNFRGGEQVAPISARHVPTSVVNVDMSGVRSDLAEVAGEVRNLRSVIQSLPKAYQLNARQYA